MKLTHILVASDLSAASELAIPHAMALGRAYGARVTLLHIDPDFPSVAAPNSSEVHADRVPELRRTLGPSLAALRSHGLHADLTLRRGDAKGSILAASADASLIIVTKHGEHATGLIVGSTASWLVQRTAIPVFVVHGPVLGPIETGPEPPSYDNITVAVDFSDHSIRALEAAIDMAAVVGATVQAVHVVKASGCEPDLSGDKVAWPEVPWKARESVDEAHAALDALVGDGCEVEVRTRVLAVADAASGIVGAALDAGSGLIFLPTHGKGWLGTALLGNTTEGVMRLSPLPVLVAPRDWLERRAANG